MLLGPSVVIPRCFLLEALLDYISDTEREKLRSALRHKGVASFPALEIESDVIGILSRLGCREIPTPKKLLEIIVNVAKY